MIVLLSAMYALPILGIWLDETQMCDMPCVIIKSRELPLQPTIYRTMFRKPGRWVHGGAAAAIAWCALRRKSTATTHPSASLPPDQQHGLSLDDFARTSADVPKLLDAVNLNRKQRSPLSMMELLSAVPEFLTAWHAGNRVQMERLWASVTKLVVDVDHRFDAAGYLNTALNNISEPPGMPLVDREAAIADLQDFIARALCLRGRALPKRTLAAVYSTRGSGKTQLLKHVLYTHFRERVERKAIMVCECSRDQSTWCTPAFVSLATLTSASTATLRSPRRFTTGRPSVVAVL